jgi:hypothetical protein
VVALSGVMIAGTAAGAWAAMSGGIQAVNFQGHSFTSGSWSFDPWPCNASCQGGRWSGWNYSGTLGDTAADGHDVFVQGKIDGYDYSTRIYYKGGAGHSGPAAQKLCAGDPASQAYLQVCTDRGTLLPDNCSGRGWYYRS